MTIEQKNMILELFNPSSNDNDSEYNPSSSDNDGYNHSYNDNDGYNQSSNYNDEETRRMVHIFSCNSLESFSDPQSANLYSKLSRVNHSCLPNVVWSGTWDDWDKAELRACKHIGKGEELVASYLGTDHYDLREIRRETLRYIWGFDCKCPLCSLTGEKLEKNEETRKHIKALSENVKEFIRNPVESAESAFCSALERLDLVTILEDEMKEALLESLIDCYILSTFLQPLKNKMEIAPESYKQKSLDLARQLGDCYVRDCKAVIRQMEQNLDK